MGLIEKLRAFAPPSSRSFHAVALDLSERLRRIEVNQWDYFANLEGKVQRLQGDLDERLRRLEEEAHDAKVRDAHARIYLEAIHRRDGESHDDARRRMFASIPPAQGAMRLCQEANARLMDELDKICGQLGIGYWFAYGTLVAALSRQGFIPWDDDIDICMMREDIAKLRDHLADDPTYQVTVVYDGFMFCKQVRFSAKDPDIPCFIDLSIWDYARDASKDHDDVLRQMRIDLMDDLAGIGGYWLEQPCLYAPGSGKVTQLMDADPADQDPERAADVVDRIERCIDGCQSRAWEQGILCSREEAGAVAYAVDNIYDAPWRRILWDLDMMLPQRRAPFEQYSFLVPNKAEEVAQECYPGYPFLPNDIFSHEHFQRELLDNPRVVDALKRFAASG